jgi:hypothetical protein
MEHICGDTVPLKHMQVGYDTKKKCQRVMMFNFENPLKIITFN